MYRKYWNYLHKYYQGKGLVLFFLLILSLLQTGLLLPIPFIIKQVFDYVLPGKSASQIIFFSFAALCLYVFSDIIGLFVRVTALRLTKQVTEMIRIDLLRKIHTLPRSYYSRIDQERMHASIIQDTERLDQVSNSFIFQFLPAIVICVGLSGILIWLDWKLFSILVISAPLMYYASKKVARKLRANTQDYYRSFENHSKGLYFVLKVLDLIKIRSAEDLEMARQTDLISQVRESGQRLGWSQLRYAAVQNIIVTFSGAIILIFGGMEVVNGGISVGSLLSFYITVALLRQYWGTISLLIPQIVSGSESLNAIIGIANSKESEAYCGANQVVLTNDISFHQVDFGYSESELILKNVNFSIGQGSVVGLVGDNGTGKSTVLHLILGLYAPSGGYLSVGGKRYQEIDISSLRRQIGVVSQDPAVFNGTIRENITYGLADVDDELLTRVANLVMLTDFIETLPQGYETVVGDRGMLLSGGQRQRIALARALVGQPRLIILDEPTNHLDRKTISRLIDNIKKLSGQSVSVMIISHEPSLIECCDSLLRIKNRTVSKYEIPS